MRIFFFSFLFSRNARFKRFSNLDFGENFSGRDGALRRLLFFRISRLDCPDMRFLDRILRIALGFRRVTFPPLRRKTALAFERPPLAGIRFLCFWVRTCFFETGLAGRLFTVRLFRSFFSERYVFVVRVRLRATRGGRFNRFAACEDVKLLDLTPCV